ncbi:hypothetical protein SDC9_26055 [bioreactor metagenome]|uniref:Uncharacterized protein n=1 Tax=bioreactor metagenome TaxID=1076179 RepID=A0A644UML9_9ZZZZ
MKKPPASRRAFFRFGGCGGSARQALCLAAGLGLDRHRNRRKLHRGIESGRDRVALAATGGRLVLGHAHDGDRELHAGEDHGVRDEQDDDRDIADVRRQDQVAQMRDVEAEQQADEGRRETGAEDDVADIEADEFGHDDSPFVTCNVTHV